MFNNKKIIVSMTSWKKRIEYVSKIIYMMERQTVIPDKIVLNLAENEFIQKENDLPKDLLLLNDTLENFEIYWVKENTKAFKKVIPTIERFFNEDCIILSIDDDYFYCKTYIENMITLVEKYPNNFLTPGNEGAFIHGWCAAYKPSFFKNKQLFQITKTYCDKIVSSDLWITLNLERNGIKPKVLKEINNFYSKGIEICPLSKQYCAIPIRQRYKACWELFKMIEKKSIQDNS